MIRFIAIALIVLGLCSVAWGGFTYKTRKKVLDVGPIQATREETHRIPVTPLAGGLIAVAGICLLLSRKV
jgi:UDP-N-acetylmuramyl pentapeptide phosphotransferase/UDP-N-acetylglucosamine-1-phosphate transferase